MKAGSSGAAMMKSGLHRAGPGRAGRVTEPGHHTGRWGLGGCAPLRPAGKLATPRSSLSALRQRRGKEVLLRAGRGPAMHGREGRQKGRRVRLSLVL